MADLSKEVQKKVPQTAADAAQPTGEPPVHDPNRLDSQIYAVLKNRVDRGILKQTPLWEKGLRTRGFIKGDQWSADLMKVLTIKNGWIRKIINKMKALETGLLSQIAFQLPRVVGLPLKRGPAAIGEANVDATLTNYALKESSFEVQQMKVAKDALHFGWGNVQMGTNKEKSGIMNILWRPAEDVVYDPDAKSIEDAKWVARRENVNIHAARHRFKDNSLVSDQKRQAAKTPATPAPPADAAKQIAPAPEDETIEIWEVWCRADALNFMDAEESSRNNIAKDSVGDKAPAFLKYLSGNGNRVFHISLNHEGLLSDNRWPFVLDTNILPIIPVTLEIDTEGLLPNSPLESSKGLQKAINTTFTFLVTQAYVSARIKFVGDKALLNQDNVKKALVSPVVGELIGVEGGFLNLQQLKFGEVNSNMLQTFKLASDQFDQVTGFNDMFGGLQGSRSAAEATIREDRAQTNSSMMRAAFEGGLRRAIRALIQIARSTLTAKQVADFIGREEMGYVNPDNGEVDDDDTKNTQATYWEDDMKPEIIRRENRIELVLNSTRRVNPQREVADMRLLIQDLIGIVGTYTQQGYRLNKTRIARKINYVFSRLLQAMGIPDYKQVEVSPEDLEIDDRLMPRGQTEEQMFAKFQEDLKKKTAESDGENADALIAFFEAVMGGDAVEAQAKVAQLSPEQRTGLVQALQGQQLP